MPRGQVAAADWISYASVSVTLRNVWRAFEHPRSAAGKSTAVIGLSSVSVGCHLSVRIAHHRLQHTDRAAARCCSATYTVAKVSIRVGLIRGLILTLFSPGYVNSLVPSTFEARKLSATTQSLTIL